MTKTLLLLCLVLQGCMRNPVVHTLACLCFCASRKQRGDFCSTANLKRFSVAVPGDTLDYVNERACHFLALI